MRIRQLPRCKRDGGMVYWISLRGSGGTADAPVLGAGSFECGFKSHLPHQKKGTCKSKCLFSTMCSALRNAMSASRVEKEHISSLTALAVIITTAIAVTSLRAVGANFISDTARGQLQVLFPAPFRVVITDSSYDHSYFYFLFSYCCAIIQSVR